MELKDSVVLSISEALSVFKDEPGAGLNIEVTSENPSIDELEGVF